MVDSQRLVHVPRWARIAALTLLIGTLASAVVLTLHFVNIDDPANPKFTDWVLVGMSLVHLTLSGLAVGLVLFYTERLFVIVWIAVPDAEADAAAFAHRLRSMFEFTYGGARSVGYDTHFEPAAVRSQRIVSLWSTVDCKNNLLLEPSHRLFWLQDMAMMVESFWRTARRNGLLVSDLEPGPL